MLIHLLCRGEDVIPEIGCIFLRNRVFSWYKSICFTGTKVQILTHLLLDYIKSMTHSPVIDGKTQRLDGVKKGNKILERNGPVYVQNEEAWPCMQYSRAFCVSSATLQLTLFPYERHSHAYIRELVVGGLTMESVTTHELC
jgi:hypothetical protein